MASSAFKPTTLRSSFLNPLRSAAFRPNNISSSYTQHILRQQARHQTTAAADGAAGAEQSKFSQFWNSKIGPKTVHFWAPIAKWGMVLAGVSDFTRPAETISLTQNMALMATGLIWTRWCFIIKPRNVFLATVNFFVFLTGSTQVTRVMMYRQSLKDTDVVSEAKDVAKDAETQVEGMVKDPKGALRKAENV